MGTNRKVSEENVIEGKYNKEYKGKTKIYM